MNSIGSETDPSIEFSAVTEVFEASDSWLSTKNMMRVRLSAPKFCSVNKVKGARVSVAPLNAMALSEFSSVTSTGGVVCELSTTTNEIVVGVPGVPPELASENGVKVTVFVPRGKRAALKTPFVSPANE